MAVPGSVNPMMLGGGQAAVYPIDQSLRLNSADSYTFRRTPGSNSTSQKKFTVSAWVKRGLLASGTGNASGRQTIFYTGLSNGSGNMFGLEWNDNGLACIFNGAGTIWPRTFAKFRDPSAWYHIVAAVDTAQATTADRLKLYVNGVEQTLTGTLPTLDFLVTNGTTSVHAVGELSTVRANIYVAELYYINDQQLTPGDFGEPNNEEVWIPKKYAGTFTGTNSCYLKFDPSATNGIGHDHSGNGNNFTPSASFNTSGTGTDVFSDTPVTNWTTFYPIHGNNVSTFSNGNLDTVCNNASTSGGTIAVSSGKWYAEFVCTAKTAVNAILGICTIDGFDADRQPNESLLGGFGTVYVMNGTYIQSGSAVSYGATWAVNDVIGVALDLDSTQNTVTFYKNGTSQGAINISNAAYVFAVGNGQGSSTVSYTANFGQRAFAYTPPTNFEALNTANLPAPTIKDGGKQFNPVTYTGNGSTQAITTVGFQPDLVWIKKRNSSASHGVHDSARVIGGLEAILYTDSNAVENTGGAYISSFDSSGFTLNANTAGNNLNDTFVAWNWLAGGSGSSNTDGSITSTVSANPSAGFSIVSFTTNNTAGATVGHGLGVAPDMIIMKYRGLTANWVVYHKNMNATPQNGYLNLNTTAGYAALTDPWNNTAPSSSVITMGAGVGSAGSTNYGTYTSIAYCFSEVAGYSKFGSYTGNGSSDGPFVYCGFRPRFLLIKGTNAGSNWEMIDTARDTYNVADEQIFANLTTPYPNYTFGDVVSNGFKIRDNSSGLQGNYNTSAQTYIFAAFAEHPFGGDGISPATAR